MKITFDRSDYTEEFSPEEMFSLDCTVLTQSLVAAFLTAMDETGDINVSTSRLSAELDATDLTGHPMMPTCVEMSKRILTKIQEFVEDSIMLTARELVTKTYDPDIVEAFSCGRRQVDLQRLTAERTEFTEWLTINGSRVDEWVKHVLSNGMIRVSENKLPRRLEYRLQKYINTRWRDQKIVVMFSVDDVIVLTYGA